MTKSKFSLMSGIYDAISMPRVTEIIMGVPLENENLKNLQFGSATTRSFHGLGRAIDHPLIYRGPLNAQHRFAPDQTVYYRGDSACGTGIFGDKNCDCLWQLQMALRTINELPDGVPGLIIHNLDEDGRGQGWAKKLRSYEPYEGRSGGHFPVPEKRRFLSTRAILRALGVRHVITMTNNPEKLKAIRLAGVEIVDRISIITDDPNLGRHLLFKQVKYGHFLNRPNKDA